MAELTKTADLEWLLETSVPSTLFRGGEWLWEAKVLVNPQSTTGHVNLGRTECHNPTLPKEDSTHSPSLNLPWLKGGHTIPSDQFEQAIKAWELECQAKSAILDDSISVQRMKRQKDQERRSQSQANLQATKDLLDSLVERKVRKQPNPRPARNLLLRLIGRISR